MTLSKKVLSHARRFLVVFLALFVSAEDGCITETNNTWVDVCPPPGSWIGVWHGKADYTTEGQTFRNRDVSIYIYPADWRDIDVLTCSLDDPAVKIAYEFDLRDDASEVSGTFRYQSETQEFRTTVNLSKAGDMITGDCIQDRLLDDGTWGPMHEIHNIEVEDATVRSVEPLPTGWGICSEPL